MSAYAYIVFLKNLIVVPHFKRE